MNTWQSRIRLTLAGLAVAALPLAGYGAIITWDGGGADADWSTDANWVGNVAPVDDDDLVFAGDTQTTNNNDIDDLVVDSIDFTGATAGFTLQGNALSINAGGSITNPVAFEHTFELDITALGDLTIDADSGDLTFDGLLTFTGGTVTIDGSETITIAGGATGSTDIVQDGGTLVIDSLIDLSSSYTLNAGELVLMSVGLSTATDLTFAGGLVTNATGALVVIAQDNAIVFADDFAIDPGADGMLVTSAIDLDGGTRIVTHEGGSLSVLVLEGVISNGGLHLVGDSGAGDEIVGLLGANTYAGGTTLEDIAVGVGTDTALGTGGVDIVGDVALAATGGERTLSNDFDLTGGSTLLVLDDAVSMAAHDLTLAGDLTGTGELRKEGDATLTLTGENSGFSGGVTLADGGLNVGSDTALGTGTLALEGGTLAAVGAPRDIANDVDIDGSFTIGGALDLELSGSIDLNTAATVSIDNTGDTEISGGIDTNGNTLTIDGDNDLLISGVISGAGGLTLDTDTTLTLTAANTFAGMTTVNDGVLMLLGSTGGPGTIGADGTLVGTGTIGGNLNVFGLLAPGTSIGEINVGGNFTLEADGVLQIEIDAERDPGDPILHDKVNVGGNVVLEDGSIVRPVFIASGPIADGTALDIITAGGSITADFTEVIVDFDSLFLDPTLSAVGSDVLLTFNVASFASEAVGPNNMAIAGALDDLLTEFDLGNTTDPTGVLGALQQFDDPAAYNAALGNVGPQAYRSLAMIQVRNTQTFNLNLSSYLSHVRAGTSALAMHASANPTQPMFASVAQDPVLMAYAINAAQSGAVQEPQNETRWQAFGQGYGLFQDVDTVTDRTGFRTTVAGGMVGLDYTINENLSLGLTAGYANTDLRFKGGLGNSDIDTFRVGPYLSLQIEDFFVDAAVTYGYHRHDMERNPGLGGAPGTAKFSGNDIAIFALGGYDFHTDDFTRITPFASLQYTHFRRSGFTESGLGGAGLTVGRQNYDSFRTLLGVRVTHIMDMGEWDLIPEAYVGWGHEFLGDDDALNASFIGAPGSPFTINTRRLDRNSLQFGAGASALLSEELSAFLRYDGEFQSRNEVHAIIGGFSIRF